MLCADAYFLQGKKKKNNLLLSGTSKGCRILALPVAVAFWLEGKRDRKQQLPELVERAVVPRHSRITAQTAEQCMLLRIDSIFFGASLRWFMLRITGSGWLAVPWRYLCLSCPGTAELPLLLTALHPLPLLTQLSHAPAARRGLSPVPQDAFRGKNPGVLSYGRRGTISSEHQRACPLPPPAVFATASISNILYDISSVFLSRTLKKNRLIPLCQAFLFNRSLLGTVFLPIVWYFQKTSGPGIRDHRVMFWYSAPDSGH